MGEAFFWDYFHIWKHKILKYFTCDTSRESAFRVSLELSINETCCTEALCNIVQCMNIPSSHASEAIKRNMEPRKWKKKTHARLSAQHLFPPSDQAALVKASQVVSFRGISLPPIHHHVNEAPCITAFLIKETNRHLAFGLAAMKIAAFNWYLKFIQNTIINTRAFVGAGNRIGWLSLVRPAL